MLQGIPALMIAGGIKTIFTYSRTITIDKTYVGSDLTDFPVLISGTFSYLKTEANGGLVKNSSGYDIVFYSDSALTTKLKFERAFWDATTGECEFWVKIPTVTTASNTVFYMSYGNQAITTEQADPDNTWRTEYKGVWHMGDGTTLSYLDSTSNNIDGTNTNTTASTGKIKGGANNASTDGTTKMTFGDRLDVGTNNFTVSFWGKTSTAGFVFIFSKRNSAASAFQPGWEIFQNNLNTDKLSAIFCDGTQSRIKMEPTGPVFADGNWHLVTVVFERAANMTLYVDGAAAPSGAISISAQQGNTDATDQLMLFREDNAQTGRSFLGDLDEARIYFGLLSADWIAAEWYNQNGVVAFYTIGDPVRI